MAGEATRGEATPTDRTTTDRTSDGTTTASGDRAGRIVGGLALLLPIGIAWLVALLLPTVQTLALSGQNVRLGRDGTPVGLANYGQVLTGPAFASARIFTTFLTIERLLIVAIVPPLLALALHAFGRGTRLSFRLLFTLPLALFAPVGTAIVWSLAYNAQFGIFGGGGRSSPLANVATARLAILRMDALVTFGLACGLGLIVYLAALRGARRPAPFIIAWLITLCATVALAVQSFAPTFILTRGGPANRTTTLGYLAYTSGFQNFQLGLGAAASTIVAIVPAILGLVVAALIAASGLRLTLVPASRPNAPVGGVGLGLALAGLIGLGLGTLAIVLYGATPLLWSFVTSLKPRTEALGAAGTFWPRDPTLDAYGRLARAIPEGRVLLNTVAPVALSVLLFQLPLAYLGALGIGALRPLGRYSEWLLLPFAPWLFITSLPLGIANFMRLQDAGGFNTFLGLIPPPTLLVPLLFILTLGFKGGATAWQAAREAGAAPAGGFFRLVIVPSLPLAALLAVAALAITMQELFWPLLAGGRATLRTIPVAQVQTIGGTTTDLPLIAAAVWRFGLPGFFLLLLVLVPFQAFYLDRLALVTGQPRATEPEATR